MTDMTPPSAVDVSAAFNQQNDKSSWKATCAGELVHFSSTNGMVSIVYDAQTGRFAVRFNKFQGAWGDYTGAIRRSLFTILNTLKSGGLPFDGPASVDAMAVIIRALPDGETYCEWESGLMPMAPAIPTQDALPPVL